MNGGITPGSGAESKPDEGATFYFTLAPVQA